MQIGWMSIDSSVVLDGLKSLIILAALLITRTLVVRWISRNQALSMESKRRWVVTTRNSIAFAFLIGLVIIWAHELQAFAVSIIALAAALVLATKELILCWSGAALRVVGKVYAVGDRIQIAGHRGVVLDHDVFATKLLEIGPGQSAHLYTGRVTVFPNSLLFTSPLIKENPGQAYGLYTLVMPIKAEEDPIQAARAAPVREIVTNPDGSTKRMFAQITNFHGFAVIDWAQKREVSRVTLPEIPEAQRNKDGIQGSPAHGLLVAPDGKTLWSTSKFNSAVYVYSMPDLKYLGEVKVGTVPDWLTFTPDSKKVYVANAHDNTVSVIDVAARKELTRIKVGQVPKRNITAVLPVPPATN